MKTAVALALTLAVVAAACSDDEADDTTVVDVAVQTTVATETTEAPADTAPADTTADTADGECESANFLIEEVNAYEQTDGYPDPELAVECTDDAFIVTTNGL
ncbi:MAG: hypothetical protein OEM22_07390, partial [Acidimicrobiia bacterium]|nr:hypothetical protein [Acidimicrobiia bacterium]